MATLGLTDPSDQASGGADQSPGNNAQWSSGGTHGSADPRADAYGDATGRRARDRSSDPGRTIADCLLTGATCSLAQSTACFATSGRAGSLATSLFHCAAIDGRHYQVRNIGRRTRGSFGDFTDAPISRDNTSQPSYKRACDYVSSSLHGLLLLRV